MRISDWSSYVCSSVLHNMSVAVPLSHHAASPAPLIDGLGRRISYLRLSVTDRCDLRCRYCMAEDMIFLPKSAVLSIEEMAELAERFVARGVRRIRLTGGEPLVRRGIRSEEHTSELQSLMRIPYALFYLKKKNK